MNLATLPVKIVNPDSAMASFVEKVNIAIMMGMIRPPPPIPPTFASASRIVMTMMPKNSLL